MCRNHTPTSSSSRSTPPSNRLVRRSPAPQSAQQGRTLPTFFRSARIASTSIQAMAVSLPTYMSREMRWKRGSGWNLFASPIALVSGPPTSGALRVSSRKINSRFWEHGMTSSAESSRARPPRWCA